MLRKWRADFRPVKSSSLTVKTSSKTTAGSIRTCRRRRREQAARLAAAPTLAVRGPPTRPQTIRALAARTPGIQKGLIPARRIQELPRNESVTAIYSSARRHFADDDRRAADRDCGVPAASGFGLAGSGLSHHSGDDVLSGGGPDGDGVVGHGAAGAAIRPGAGAEPDDLQQFAGQLNHHTAIQSRPEH